METIRSLWWGRYSLPQAFWGFYILGSVVAFICCGLILVASYRLQAGTIGFILGFALLNGYWILAAVGVWRSASAATTSLLGRLQPKP
jgi:hypothetical protein